MYCTTTFTFDMTPHCFYLGLSALAGCPRHGRGWLGAGVEGRQAPSFWVGAGLVWRGTGDLNERRESRRRIFIGSTGHMLGGGTCVWGGGGGVLGWDWG